MYLKTRIHGLENENGHSRPEKAGQENWREKGARLSAIPMVSKSECGQESGEPYEGGRGRGRVSLASKGEGESVGVTDFLSLRTILDSAQKCRFRWKRNLGGAAQGTCRANRFGFYHFTIKGSKIQTAQSYY